MKKTPAPVLVDSSIHTAFTIKYVIYALFGALAALFGSETLEAVAGEPVARVIGSLICGLSIAAAIASHFSLNDPVWEKVELYATIATVSFIGTYCAFATWLVVVMGDDSRIPLAMIAAALIVFPMWRVIQIIKKLRRIEPT